MAKKIIEGLWDCQFCDTKGIRGSIRECPGCGKPRGDNVKFYLPGDYKSQEGVELTEEEKLPDWQCEYCGSYNKATNTKCYRCEAPREGKDYYQLHKDVKESSYSESHVNTNWKCGYCGVENPKDALTCKNCGAERGAEKKKEEKPANNKPWPLRHPILMVLGVIVLIIIIIIILNSIKHGFVAEGFKWETSVDVEEYKTVEESDWELPDGARLLYTREEIHHYSKNDLTLEGPKENAVDESSIASNAEKVNQSAYEASHNPFLYKVYADDLGNGYFEVDDGGGSGGETDTSTPVYATKYYYEIERWVVTRTETASGTDQDPYEPEIELGPNERKGSVRTDYYVYASKDGKEEKYYSVSESDFFALSEGMEFEASGMGSSIHVEW